MYNRNAMTWGWKNDMRFRVEKQDISRALSAAAHSFPSQFQNTLSASESSTVTLTNGVPKSPVPVNLGDSAQQTGTNNSNSLQEKTARTTLQLLTAIARDTNRMGYIKEFRC
ncbi:hypothetical protein BDR04DRAFT_1116588 [Suillus decipiens]|nr:hypothetical protein BDR04DRAFT_1116588 [Suillus decipiens]